MDIKELILERINNQASVKTSNIMEETGFSRTYITRILGELQEEGKIIRVGKANRTHYVKAEKEKLKKARKAIKDIHLTLKNENLLEDIILNKIQKETGIFIDLAQNIEEILEYTFTEILNNAIEHSGSEKIKIKMNRDKEKVRFIIEDFGIGIFKNIRQKKNLNNDLEAIQDLLKGKQTTAPKEHSGEGIFFTSKAADVLTIRGINKKVIFNNLIEDVFIYDTKQKKEGTRVVFIINLDSKQSLKEIFRQFTGEGFAFKKTEVKVDLFNIGEKFISRSQARRIVTGLNKFEKIFLDFKDIKTVGQGFA
ncbi:MAG: ATP-binding protein, partial [Elusimicrobiota bacterium]